MEEQRSPGKPFDISKWEVQRAWGKVRANKGAPGVDDVSIAEFEKNLKGNLYKIWNRMSSGAYFPPPVKAVEIPRAGGGARLLGVPTIADRVAQTVVAARIEAAAEPVFHGDSYGYRPERGATFRGRHRVPALAPVPRPPQACFQFGKRAIERHIPIVRRRFRADDRATRPDRQLNALAPVGLTRITLGGNLHVDPDRSAVQPFDLGELG